MCGSLFKSSSSSSAAPAPTPAVSVAAPTKTNAAGLDAAKDNHSVRAKGKRRLTIPVAGSGGTGLNV